MRGKRRLITLISAGRNRIVMIRRELPRTEGAGWAVSPYRTKLTRVLLPRSARPAACTVARVGFISRSFQPAIPSCQERVGRRRRAPSRPRAARRREALTGGGDAVRIREREWQALRPVDISGRTLYLRLARFDAHGDGPEKAQQVIGIFARAGLDSSRGQHLDLTMQNDEIQPRDQLESYWMSVIQKSGSIYYAGLAGAAAAGTDADDVIELWGSLALPWV